MKKPSKNKSAYFALWGLLSVAIIIFLVISFTEGISFFKNAPFKETLLAGTESDTVVSQDSAAVPDLIFPDVFNQADSTGAPQDNPLGGAASPAPVAAGNAASTPASTATAAGTTSSESGAAPAPAVSGGTARSGVKSVFLFGDSMTILIANRMGEYGAQNGFKVNSVTWDGSNSITWTNDEKIKDYIAEYNPDFIIVVMGSNECIMKNFDKREPNIRDVVAKIGNIPFIWVGPPQWKEDKGFNAMMSRILGNRYFASTMTLPRGKDHIHPTPSGGVTWTDSLMRWLDKARVPIGTLVPEPGTKSNNQRVYIPIKKKKE